ncbi:hypothetical protein H634G_03955 [Metarhizium anisopliae BRIP 53293]|uniref:Uncharacterized protein n=1 Tax=Metarhizium anisopliae BRIP 53293 TaxID=1291518 RepID=A0A0D9P3Y4_METAN|nr:hypothetical protein H634G_03955 [Metarhizium anisopliae BRIP 53293]
MGTNFSFFSFKMGTDDDISAPSQDAIESARALYHSIRGALPEAVTDFESKWTAWQEVCQGQTSWPSLDACTRTDEFEALKRLGPKILPFVVFKLATNADHNSYGVFLYNTMEKDAEYRGSPDEPLVSDEVLRRHGKFAICCEGSDEYYDLVEMGPSIIAPLMVEYPSDIAGYWYEVLHKIIHSRNMGAYMVQKGALYDAWYRFFNGGADYDQAPLYIPNEWDEFILQRKISPGRAVTAMPSWAANWIALSFWAVGDEYTKTVLLI